MGGAERSTGTIQHQIRAAALEYLAALRGYAVSPRMALCLTKRVSLRTAFWFLKSYPVLRALLNCLKWLILRIGRVLRLLGLGRPWEAVTAALMTAFARAWTWFARAWIWTVGSAKDVRSWRERKWWYAKRLIRGPRPLYIVIRLRRTVWIVALTFILILIVEFVLPDSTP